VAEGVESEDQRRKLEAENVNVGQGFLFARPLDVEAIDQLLETETLSFAIEHP
jgi:EAL domain-containing protein (putative c-di-GMP-specific phosphodiesterase class I)